MDGHQLRHRVYDWQDRDDDVTASIEAWPPGSHPSIVGVLRLATTEDAAVGQTSCGIFITKEQAREIARVLTELASGADRTGDPDDRDLILKTLLEVLDIAYGGLSVAEREGKAYGYEWEELDRAARLLADKGYQLPE